MKNNANARIGCPFPMSAMSKCGPDSRDVVSVSTLSLSLPALGSTVSKMLVVHGSLLFIAMMVLLFAVFLTGCGERKQIVAVTGASTSYLVVDSADHAVGDRMGFWLKGDRRSHGLEGGSVRARSPFTVFATHQDSTVEWKQETSCEMRSEFQTHRNETPFGFIVHHRAGTQTLFKSSRQIFPLIQGIKT